MMEPDMVDDMTNGQVSNEQNDAAEETTGASKRIKITKLHKQIMVMVSIAGIMVGACFVTTVYFIRLFGFNSKVLEGKDQAISNYSETIKNIGICNKPSGSTYTVDELKKCSPNNILSDSIPGTLRYNLMAVTASNQDLESVARELQSTCYKDGKVIDYKTQYELEESEEKRSEYLEMMKTCSALRAVPDALPSQKNTEALLASLDRFFEIASLPPIGLSPDKSKMDSPYKGVGAVPLNLSFETDVNKAVNILTLFENSIRTFDITTASIEWSANGAIKFGAKARAYYTSPETITEKDVKVYADTSKKRSSGAKK